jgi:hypothetical protein
MIGNRLCISDYNRSREMRAGKNARGNAPVKLLERPLHSIELMVEVDGEARRLRDRETSGMSETMVQILRTTKGEISFGFVGSGLQRRQETAHVAELAAEGEASSTQPRTPAHSTEIGREMDRETETLAAEDERNADARTVSGEPLPEPATRLSVAKYRRGLFLGTALIAAVSAPAARRSPRRFGATR